MELLLLLLLYDYFFKNSWQNKEGFGIIFMVSKMQDVLKKISDYIIEDNLEDIMGDRFGKYSKYIIQERAIPDVRDGLKPVQRRIIYAMYKNKNVYEHGFVKSAQTVGEVIGKYHPHGDSSVYDAMVRMSQDWKQSCPYIEFQGNNGSIDGDPAAAYRYTEAKLSKISNELIRDIEKNTVDMTPTFDDSRVEPTVLPARFPNLLLNGATGISAGYATNIPPHNLGELIEATVLLIKNPETKLDELIKIVKGPDFPTGGIIYGQNGIISAYTNGKGKIVVRSKYTYEKNKGKAQIIISEIPFEVNKANLVRKINEIKIDKKIDGISEVRDESDKEGLRIAIDLKSGADKNLITNYLLKNTELQVSYSFNMVAIVDKRPKQVGLLTILKAYIAHQKEVVTRRTQYDYDFASKKLHITEGLVKALAILDEVIKVIRASKNKADAKDNLISKFDFSEKQASAILDLQLYRLTNLDVLELEKELENLRKVITFLQSILNSEQMLNKVIVDELEKLKEEYATKRKTKIIAEIEEIKLDAKEMIPEYNVIVVVTNEGYIKKVNLKSYASSNEQTTLKPGDYILGLYEVTTLDTLLLFTNKGRYLYLPVHAVPDGKWKELGKHVNNVIMLDQEEKIIASFVVADKEDELVLTTKLGQIKRTKVKDFEVSRYSKAMVAMKLKSNDELLCVKRCDKQVLLVTKSGYYLKYLSEEIPLLGVKASGVKAMNLKDDEVVFVSTLDENMQYLNIFTSKNTAKRLKVCDLQMGSRAKRGNMLLKRVKSVNYEVAFALTSDSKTEIGMKSDSEIVKLKNSDIPIMDLNSTGSLISKHQIDDVFKFSNLLSFLNKDSKSDEKEDLSEKEEEKISAEPQLSIEDFLDDFKL